MAQRNPNNAAHWVETFLSRARCRALAAATPLPEHEAGTALFVDISGFTPLTESLGQHLGARRGAETLTAVINEVFEVLIAQVHRYGGDVVGFAGDAMLCWFGDATSLSPPPGPGGRGEACSRALTAAHAMQQEMMAFQAVPTPDGQTHTLTMKAGLAQGPIRRFTTGDPAYGRFDMLTGATLTRMAAAEHQAAKGEIVAAPEIGPLLGGSVEWGPARDGFLPLHALRQPAPEVPAEPVPALPLETLRPFFPPTLLDWLVSTGEGFLGELRPVISAFVRFEGLDYADDPQAGTKLDRYVSALQEGAARYGGSLIRLEYGDKGSVAHVVFGAPVAHEDDEARAVGWILELQDAVRELPFLTQYIGMTRGQVYAGALGATTRRGYTLMGDEVNASARLMQACQPGQVLVSQRIMQATQKRFSFHQFPGFQVKGKFEPVPVATPVAPLPALQQLVPVGPLIGRQEEMARLEELLDGLTADGQGAVLRLSGPEGVGKSRLVAEVLQHAMQRGVRVLSGSGQSVGRTTPYLPWREMLRAILGVQSAWPVQQQAMQIQTMVQWIQPEWLPRIPLFGDILGLEIPDTPTTAALDTRLRQESLFALLGDFFAQLAAQQPLLLLLEDCHWFDEATSALTQAMARRLAADRALWIATHRPPLDPEQPLLPDLDNLSNYKALELAELTPEATGILVTERLGGDLPSELLSAVQERTQGNPLFVEEMAATLRESGRLQQVAGRWTLVGVESQSLVLPDSIRAVALARMDALDEGSRFTLKVASVAGRTFETRVVQDVHPAEPSTAVLGKQLETLKQRDLILEEKPQQSYRFKHNVTQEAAYEVLLYAQRQTLHRAIAAWYEQHHAATLSAYYALLAHHYHGAEEPAQERRYARLAGEQAAARYANAAALRYLNRAMELTPEEDLPARYELLLVRERVYDLQGNREFQAQDLEALQALADALGEAPRCIEVALRRGRYAESAGDYDGAIAAAQAAISLAESGDDVQSEAAGRLQWGRALWLQGEFAQAREQVERSLDQARQADSARQRADAFLNLGNIALYQGDYHTARSRLEEARAVYQELGDPVGENKSLNNLGNVLSLVGDVAAAQSTYEQALRVCRQIGWRRGESVMLGNLGITYESQGDYGTATQAYEQALQTSREIGDAWSEARTLSNLGLVLLAQGAYAPAQEKLEHALGIYRGLGNARDEGMVLSSLALLAHLEGQDDAAREYSDTALQLARQMEDQATEAEALTHLGHAQAGLGNAETAAASYRQAAAIRREIGEETLAIESLAGLVRAALAQGDQAAALAVAEEILSHLEAQSLDGTYEPLRIHLTCYRALREHADPRASAVLARAYRLLQERAGQIGDEAMRRSFLKHVAAHREVTVALAQDPEAAAIVKAQVPDKPAEEVLMKEAVPVEEVVPVPVVPVEPEPVEPVVEEKSEKAKKRKGGKKGDKAKKGEKAKKRKGGKKGDKAKKGEKAKKRKGGKKGDKKKGAKSP